MELSLTGTENVLSVIEGRTMGRDKMIQEMSRREMEREIESMQETSPISIRSLEGDMPHNPQPVVGSEDKEESTDLPDTNEDNNPSVTPKEDMNQRLWNVAERTKLNGNTETGVVEWMPEDYSGTKPRIRYENPVKEGNTETYSFVFPQSADDTDYDFVRFLNKYGLSVRSAEKITDYEIEVEHSGDEDDRWTPVIPDKPEPPKKERGKEFIGGSVDNLLNSKVTRYTGYATLACTILAFYPVTMWGLGYWVYKEEGEIAPTVCVMVMGVLFSLLFWTLFMVIDGHTFQFLFETYMNGAGETGFRLS